MRATIIAAAVLAGAGLTMPAANAGTLIPVTPVSGASNMLVVDINDKNVITGGYETGNGYHGFLGSIDGNYTLFDYPAGGTEGRAINNDGYVLAIGNPTGENFYEDSFARKTNGDLVPLTKGKKIRDGLDQGLRQSNTNFVAEEWAMDENENVFVYGYYGKGTKYKSDLVLPFSTDRTRPRGVNKSGTVVGYYHDSANANYAGFVLDGNVVKTTHYPDAQAYWTFLSGINDKGVIAGYWSDKNATIGQAFVYNPDSDTFDLIDVPGATSTQAFGVNSKGFIAISSNVGAFIYCPAKPSKCPAAPGAIEIKERKIAATPGSTRIASCERGCLVPARSERLLSPGDTAKLREAEKSDPARIIELGLKR